MRQHFQNRGKESIFGNILLTDLDKWHVICKHLLDNSLVYLECYKMCTNSCQCMSVKTSKKVYYREWVEHARLNLSC